MGWHLRRHCGVILSIMLSAPRCSIVVMWMVSVLALCSVLFGQTTPFLGTWQPQDWKPDRRNRGIVFHIVQNGNGLGGTVRFYDRHSDHESIMVNPKLSARTLAFDVDDEYVGAKLRFSMTVDGNGKSAVVKGGGGEMVLDFKLVKQP